ncbi:MAG: dihydroorotase, partial [Brachybacterium tyrofermentans]
KPAEIGRDEDQGQVLEPGAPAHVLVWDPRSVRAADPAEHASRSRNSPFAGIELPGRNRLTVLEGRPTVRDGLVVER